MTLLHRIVVLALIATTALASSHALADEPQEIQELLENGSTGEAETRARALLEESEKEYGLESREVAAARDLLVESLWKSEAGPDSLTLELAEETVDLRRRLDGRDTIAVAKSLYHLAIILDILEGPLASRSYFEEVVGILGVEPDEPGTLHARAQYSLGQNLARLGELDTALGSYEKARDLYVQLEGAESARVASVLVGMGRLYLSMGQPDDAEGIFREALAIREHTHGADDPATCQLHTNLAACSYYMGDFEEAGSRQRDALACLRKTLPEDAPPILHGLKNLAWLESEYGNFAAADSAYVRILKLQEARDGHDDPATLELYRIYGAHLYLSGAYSDALIMVQIAVDGLRSALGARAPQTDSAISTLAEIHRVLGHYEDARRLYEESAQNLEAQGSQQPSLAMRYNGLGLIAMDLGDAAEAQRWFEQALALSREYEGETHYHTGRAYANLGDAEALAGDTSTALERYTAAMEIFENEMGPESPDFVQSSIMLGQILAQHGDLDRAVEVLERSYASLAKQTQPIFVGLNRHELARIRLRQERFAEAEELETEAIENLGVASGQESHPVAISLIIRGWARTRQGKLDAAFEDAQRAETIGSALTSDLIPWLPERTALTWAQRRPRGTSLMWEVARRTHAEKQIQLAWESTIRSRARTLDELGRRVRIAAAVTDAETRQLIDDYRRSRERLANAVLDGNSDASTLETANLEKERAERRLSDSLASELQPSSVDGSQLAEHIPPDTALLSYLQIRDERGTPTRYLALVQGAGEAGPNLFDLGEAESLDALMAEWGSAMCEGSRAVGPLAIPAIDATREIGNRLRERVWDPVAAALADQDQVLIVPDGSLHGLAFVALPVGDDTWLLDEAPLLVTLSAERDLIEAVASSTTDEARLFCIGDPNFDHESLPVIAQSTEAVFRGEHATCVEFADLEFASLPRSAEEVGAVSRLWAGAPPTRLLGTEATEDAIKLEAGKHSVLHLATHAFYLGSECGASEEDEGELARSRVLRDNPLLLSGLALAGANQRMGEGSDGILTAEEVAALDLTQVDLAVLSACKTGSGLTVAGEGVLGLRRAFRLAGARVLVTSLWPVEDQAAAEWMEEFYSALWSEGNDPGRAAQQASLRSRQLRTDAGLSAHPAHWAAFVVSR